MPRKNRPNPNIWRLTASFSRSRCQTGLRQRFPHLNDSSKIPGLCVAIVSSLSSHLGADNGQSRRSKSLFKLSIVVLNHFFYVDRQVCQKFGSEQG
jgi:hypothetical protein